MTAVVLASFAGGPPGLAQDAGDSRLTGDIRVHAVKRSDTLSVLGARFGVEPRTLAADNGLAITDVLAAGSRLRIDNRHIVPEALAAATTIEPVRELALSQGLTDRVDWEAARRVVQVRRGLLATSPHLHGVSDFRLVVGSVHRGCRSWAQA